MPQFRVVARPADGQAGDTPIIEADTPEDARAQYLSMPDAFPVVEVTLYEPEQAPMPESPEEDPE